MEEKEFGELTEKLNKLILLSQVKYATRIDKDLAEANLTGSAVKLLQFLDFLAGSNIGRLAQALGATPSFTSKLASDLEEGGLVKKEENPDEGREIILQITKKGKELLEKVGEANITRRINLLRGIANDLGENKLKIFFEIVDYLLSKLEKEI